MPSISCVRIPLSAIFTVARPVSAQFYNGIQLLLALYRMQPSLRIWEFTEELQVGWLVEGGGGSLGGRALCNDFALLRCVVVLGVQLLIVGVSFIVLAVCNFKNTVATMHEKRVRSRQIVARSGSAFSVPAKKGQ